MGRPKATVVISTKNPGVAILLTILFGPIGMLYSTIAGALIMSIASLAAIFLTAGLGLLLVWPVSIIWAGVAASSFNRRVLSQ